MGCPCQNKSTMTEPMSDYSEYDNLMDSQNSMTPTTKKLIVGGSLAVAAALLIAVAQRKKIAAEKIADGADATPSNSDKKQDRPTASIAKRLKRHGFRRSGESVTWTGEYAGTVQTVTIRRGDEKTQEPSKAMARKLNAKYDKIVGEQQ